jgi:hypothetical protein
MIMLNTSYVGLAFVLIILAVYFRTIKSEERALTMKFGQPYLDYKGKVPRLIPTIFRYKAGEKWPFSFKRIIENKEYKLFVWVINIVIIFRLKGYFLIDHQSMDMKKMLLIGLFVFLASIDIGGEIFKWHRKRLQRTEGRG